MVVAGGGFDEPDAWFTNDSNGGTVVFLLIGEPAYVVRLVIHGITGTEVNRRWGVIPWIEDYRAWENTAEGLISVIKSRGLGNSTIGLVGHKDPVLAMYSSQCSFGGNRVWKILFTEYRNQTR